MEVTNQMQDALEHARNSKAWWFLRNKRMDRLNTKLPLLLAEPSNGDALPNEACDYSGASLVLLPVASF